MEEQEHGYLGRNAGSLFRSWEERDWPIEELETGRWFVEELAREVEQEWPGILKDNDIG